MWTGSGASMRVTVRGFIRGSLDQVTLTWKADGKTTRLVPELNNDNFVTCLDVPMTSQTMQTALGMALKDKSVMDSQIGVDSVDIIVLPHGTRPLKAGRCPPLEKSAAK